MPADSQGYKRPESVLVVIHTVDAEVLLLQRQHPADFWQSVTGSLRWGEEQLAAAQREVEEETGLQVADDLLDCERINRYPIHPAWRHRYAPNTLYNTEHVFRMEYQQRPEIRLHCEEHQGFIWVPREEAAAQVGSASNRAAILDFVPPRHTR